MNQTRTWVCGLLLVSLAASAGARETVDSLFGEKIRAARASSETADNVALAKRILQDAEIRPRLTVPLAKAAADLTTGIAEGRGVWLEAMDLQVDLDPKQRETLLSEMLPVQQAMYDEATGADRDAPGHGLIGTLLQLARIELRSARVAQAEQRLAAAAPVAASIRSPRRKEIQDLRLELERRKTAAERTQELVAALEANPNDQTVRTELLLARLTLWNDPNGAAELLTPAIDDVLRSYVPLASKAPADLPGPVAHEMSAWYGELVDKTPPWAQPELLARQRAWLNRFLQTYTKDDMQRQTSTMELARIDERLVELAPGGPAGNWVCDSRALSIAADANTAAAINRARTWLLAQQKPNGSWPGRRATGASFADSRIATALATWALLRSGESADSPTMRRALRRVAAYKADNTLLLAVRCGTLAASVRDLHGRYLPQLQADVNALCQAGAEGAFVYELKSPGRRGSLFYTFHALCGLSEASAGGADIPRAIWSAGLSSLKGTQRKDGAWGSVGLRDTGNYPLSVLGQTASLACLEGLGLTRQASLNQGSVKNAQDWLAPRFDSGQNSKPLQYLWALGRLGVARGERVFGATNWYAWASNDLVRHQDDKGYWKSPDTPAVAGTAMGLLTLTTATSGW